MITSIWPRLTDTLPHPHPERCGHCDCPGTERNLELWQEHDNKDRPEPKFIVLCTPCSDQIIEPHVRLYRKVDNNSPAPGAMALCIACKHRVRYECRNWRAKHNGGDGLSLTTSKPMRGFADGTDKRGRRVGWRFCVYPTPPTRCTGFEQKTELL